MKSSYSFYQRMFDREEFETMQKGGRSVPRIKNGRGGGGGVSSDLLVCFPTRAHLTLMPKPVSSPSRPTATDSKKRQQYSRPVFRSGKPARNNQTGSDIGSEPTSPKVTCAGQIKVRPKNQPINTHNSVIRPKNWLESVGLNKADVMSFLRGMRFGSMHCFGSFPGPVNIDSSDEEEEEEEEEEVVVSGTSSRNYILSKWFMVMEEYSDHKEEEEEEEEEEEAVPPKNALLLMRCRSAPAKRGDDVAKKVMIEEEEEEKKREEERSLIMMMRNYAPNFFDKLSTDIAKETWLVGSTRGDPLARSRSWRR